MAKYKLVLALSLWNVFQTESKTKGILHGVSKRSTKTWSLQLLFVGIKRL